ncbi:MAG TPA: hypothetical protein VIG93_05855 [Gaiellaceae bacterium]
MADPSETTQISPKPDLDDSADVLEAIHELSGRVAGLQTELHALRAQSRSLPSAGAETHGWEKGATDGEDTLAWIRSLDSPGPRRPAVPRLLLEVAFLAAVAVAAAIAELEAPVIVALMVGAWVLVALAEWTAAGAARRRAEAAYMPLPGPGQGFASDPSWFAPPVERTVLDVVEDEDDTAGRLPPPSP